MFLALCGTIARRGYDFKLKLKSMFYRHNSDMIDLFFHYNQYLKTEVPFKRKLSKADFSNFAYFFNNAMSESRLAKLNAVIKWMIIQFYCKDHRSVCNK